MRYYLNKNEIEEAVNIIVNKFEISTNLLNELYGKKLRVESEAILHDLAYNEFDKKTLCRMILTKEGVNLLAGSSEVKRNLRKKILDKLSDEVITELYNKYPDNNKKIVSVSYMRKPLAEKKWHSGKRWAQDFVLAAGLPRVLAGISIERESSKSSVEIIEPKRKVPELVEYQIDIKKQLLSILRNEGDKTRCMISLPTGGGKTRVAVEAFLDWLQGRFEENKYLLWVAQSEELCEQCISCIEQMWTSREFILPLKVYRYFSKYEFTEDDLHGGVVVASINKIYNRLKSMDAAMEAILYNTGAIIIDEAHRASSSMYDYLFEKAEMLTDGKLFPVCGLSATPGRNTIISEDEVNKLVDRFQMNLITPKFAGEINYQKNPLEYFKEHRYLAKVNHIVYKSGIEIVLSEQEIKELSETGEYSPSLLKSIANNTKRNILIIKRLLKIKRGEPTLVYACTVEHAAFLATMLSELGRKTASINSDTNKMERRLIINDFTEGNIDFLFNFGVLTTGFDAPKTRNIVICRPINSNILYEQIVGRGIRGTEFGGTEECDVIDFSDNIHNLGEQKAFMRFKHYWDMENNE